jgi:hypothetical protein
MADKRVCISITCTAGQRPVMPGQQCRKIDGLKRGNWKNASVGDLCFPSQQNILPMNHHVDFALVYIIRCCSKCPSSRITSRPLKRKKIRKGKKNLMRPSLLPFHLMWLVTLPQREAGGEVAAQERFLLDRGQQRLVYGLLVAGTSAGNLLLLLCRQSASSPIIPAYFQVFLIPLAFLPA